jgi:hypothetical protein
LKFRKNLSTFLLEPSRSGGRNLVDAGIRRTV